MVDRNHATMKAQLTAGDVRTGTHQSPTTMTPHDADRKQWVCGSEITRSCALIPGIITVVFRDRNTNAVAKFSSTAAKKFITQHNRFKERACVALIFNLSTIWRADEIFRAGGHGPLIAGCCRDSRYVPDSLSDSAIRVGLLVWPSLRFMRARKPLSQQCKCASAVKLTVGSVASS